MLEVISLELSQISKSLAIFGGFIVFYGLVSNIAKERFYLSEPLLAVTVGIIIGPHVLNWVNPFEWSSTEMNNEITYQLTRLVMAVQVLFTGIALPKKYLWREKQSLAVLLFLIMTTAWFVTALLVWGIIGHLSFLESLCIASCVTPTDPVLANSITSGHFAETHVPENVRRIILAESGANDGLGFPFLFIAVYLLARTHEDYGETVGDEIWRWFYGTIVYQVLLSTAYGAVVGYVARKALRWAAKHNLIDMSNFFSYGFGLAMFTLGTAGLFGTDDILACFICGNSFTWDDWFRLRLEENDFQEIIDMLFNTAIFLYIGTIIPWQDYSDASKGLSGWRVVVLGITVLLVRRLPWVMAVYKIIPALSNWKEAAFTGWFGPIGVGAIYYIHVALREVPSDNTRTHLREVVNPVVLFCVFSSVVTHGITIPIARFGPKLVRHTTTMTQSSQNLWARNMRYYLCFWQEDSYWRALEQPQTGIDKKTIGAPDAPRPAGGAVQPWAETHHPFGMDLATGHKAPILEPEPSGTHKGKSLAHLFSKDPAEPERGLDTERGLEAAHEHGPATPQSFPHEPSPIKTPEEAHIP